MRPDRGGHIGAAAENGRNRTLVRMVQVLLAYIVARFPVRRSLLVWYGGAGGVRSLGEPFAPDKGAVRLLMSPLDIASYSMRRYSRSRHSYRQVEVWGAQSEKVPWEVCSSSARCIDGVLHCRANPSVCSWLLRGLLFRARSAQYGLLRRCLHSSHRFRVWNIRRKYG